MFLLQPSPGGRARHLLGIFGHCEEKPVLALERFRERPEPRNDQLARGTVLLEEDQHAAPRLEQVAESAVASADQRQVEVRRARAGYHAGAHLRPALLGVALFATG